MTLDNSGFHLPSSSLQPNYATQRLKQIQADLLSTAQIWAVEEVGAAMAHQLKEPLAALLRYLREMKSGAHSAATETVQMSNREMVENALRETERICEIMERMGQIFETPVEVGSRGREAIDRLTRNSDTKGNGYGFSVPANSSQRLLTPREREVLAMIAGGASNKEGGQKLGISTRTFEAHRAHIMGKLGAKNAADLVRIALSQERGV